MSGRDNFTTVMEASIYVMRLGQMKPLVRSKYDS